jgi:tryptophan synthase alpha chain
MNNLSEIFKGRKALITYLTAGDPNLKNTKDFILAMARGGADLVEIGLPFSDPVAEGPVIEAAMARAINNVKSLDDVFAMAAEVKKESNVGLSIMSYANPIFSYGYVRFFKKCKDIGIKAFIAPDIPFEEQDEVKEYAQKNDVAVISFIAPTSRERIEAISKNAHGFIYLISSLGLTGVRSKITTDIASLVSSIKQYTDVPVAVGFGISTPEQAREISQSADGIIIGSAIVKIIAQYGPDAAEHIENYVKSIRAVL